jgi:anti-sigma factor RsiW
VPHISEDILDQYALNKLPESEAAALEQHLPIWPDCEDRLQLTNDFIAAMRAVRRGKADGLLKG